LLFKDASIGGPPAALLVSAVLGALAVVSCESLEDRRSGSIVLVTGSSLNVTDLLVLGRFSAIGSRGAVSLDDALDGVVVAVSISVGGGYFYELDKQERLQFDAILHASSSLVRVSYQVNRIL
jgi:uncharacterized membrane protein YeiH